MKRLVKILKLAIFLVASIGLLCIGMMHEWRTEVILATFLFGGIVIAYFLGFFDISESPIDRHLSIKHGARQVRHAA